MVKQVPSSRDSQTIPAIQEALFALWYAPHALPVYYWCLHLLKMFSSLYWLIVVLRAYLYRWCILSRDEPVGVPVIVVGNITVGGTGKTPLICSLFHALTQKGYTPGIISRGYKGQYTDPALCVTAQTPVSAAGDEAVMLAKKLHGPVVVGRRRCAAAHHLLQVYPNCDVILSDDGLQHYRLPRQMEVVVVDAVRQWGNGYLLPGGPLREPVSRVADAQCVVYMHTAHVASQSHDVAPVDKAPGRCPRFDAHVRLAYFEHLLSGKRYRAFSALPFKAVHALAGIGQPNKFFHWLEMGGLYVQPHPFSDHHRFSSSDIDWGEGDMPVLMTEKDAVKCSAWVDNRHWQVVVEVVIPPALLDCILSYTAVE